MKTKLGLGLVAAGMFAMAGSAQAAPYDGLAFNNSDFTTSEGCYFGGTYPNCNAIFGPNGPGWGYSNTSADYLFSRLWTNYASGVELDRPTDTSLIGQAKYDVTGTVAPTGMNNETITFGEADKVMTFGSTTLRITGGELTIKEDGADNPGDPREPGDVTVTLPDDISGLPALGEANPDYWLLGSLFMSVDGGAPIEFTVCEFVACLLGDGEEPSEPYPGQPYNTLNVGDNAGEEDLAMWLYLEGKAEDTYYRYEYSEWSEWERVNHCNESATVDCKWKNGKKYKRTRTVELVPCDPVEYAYYCGNGDCHRVEGDKYVLKLALWGFTEGENEVPEPATLSLLGLGLVGVGAAARRRRKAA